MERTLSLDLSTTCTGYSIFENGIYARSDKIKLRKELKYEKWLEMVFSVIILIEGYENANENINSIVIEDGFVGVNKKSSLELAKTRGSIEFYCFTNRIYFAKYLPSEWRKIHGIKGNRKDEKQQAIDLVFKKYGILVGDDEAESILLGEYHIEEGYKK